MEAFCELFFDNLATLLGVTGSAVGHVGYGLIAAPWRFTPPLYNTLIAVEWERIYYEVGRGRGIADERRTHALHGFFSSVAVPISFRQSHTMLFPPPVVATFRCNRFFDSSFLMHPRSI